MPENDAIPPEDDDFDDELERILELDRAAEQRSSGIHDNVKSARDRIVGMRIKDGTYKIITDSSHGVVLANRHQTLNIKRRVLETALSQKRNLLIALQQDVLKNGGFFEDYTADFESNRIENSIIDPNEGGWMIVESLGKLTHKDFSLSPEMAGGDMQFKIPSVRSTGFVESLRLNPKKKKGRRKDRINSHNREIWDEIAENPASAGWVSDVCSLRGSNAFGNDYFPPKGFAHIAKEGVFAEVRKLNLERKIPIRWALSAVAEVIRLWNKAKTKSYDFHPTLLNQRGLDITQRERVGTDGVVYRNAYLGKQMGRLMEVELPAGDKGYLEFTWHIAGEEIWKPGDEIQEK